MNQTPTPTPFTPGLSDLLPGKVLPLKEEAEDPLAAAADDLAVEFILNHLPSTPLDGKEHRALVRLLIKVQKESATPEGGELELAKMMAARSQAALDKGSLERAQACAALGQTYALIAMSQLSRRRP